MAKQQKDTVMGQLLPWAAVIAILEMRDQTRVPNNIHARTRQLIDELADRDFAAVVAEYLYGG